MYNCVYLNICNYIYFCGIISNYKEIRNTKVNTIMYVYAISSY